MLDTLYIGKNIIELDVVDSTNSYASGLTNEATVHEGTVVVAHYQGAGKGQRGNVWVSEPGKNLTFTLVLKPKFINASQPFIISKVISLAICKYLEKLVDEDVFIKWPNDIYIGTQKVCGILIENQFRGKNIEYALVGVGLNVNQTNFDSLSRVTSMALTLKKSFDLKSILHGLLKSIEVEYLRLQKGEEDALNKEYLESLLFIEEMRKYKVGDSVITGEIKNVLPSGKLEILTQQGESKNFDIKEIEFVF